MESGIMITNVRSTVDEKLIRNTFDKFGKILFINIVPDRVKENYKVCYVNFTCPESAKDALEQFDKSTIFGDPLRISYKKYIDKNQINGNASTSINRNQSFGRGRGFANESNKSREVSQSVLLRNIDLQLNIKIEVEIIELKNPNNILVRPILETKHSKPKLTDLLSVINENVNSLTEVRVPEIGGFYLAQWKDDGNFYRAKLLEKLGNNKYEVCFVDEGTSGDVVEQLRNIPNEIADIPCQFIQCTMECKESQELVKLIVSNGYTAKVSIFVTNPVLADGCKYRISLFIDDNDSIDLFKKQYKNDPRLIQIPNETNLKRHSLETKLLDFQVLDYPKQSRDNFKIVLLNKASENDGKLRALEFSPITGDLILYKCPGSAPCRVVIDSISFSNEKPSYKIRYIDRDAVLQSVSIDSLWMPIDSKSLTDLAPHLLNCVMDLSSPLLTAQDVRASLIISDFDSVRLIYVVSVVRHVSKPTLSIGHTVRALVTSVESLYEFYAQPIDSDSTNTLELVQSAIANAEPIGKTLTMKDLAIGTHVVAPFLGANYRALVEEVNQITNSVRVFFIDYGNREWVEFRDLKRVPHNDISNTTVTPGLALRCSLPAKIKRGSESVVTELLQEYLETGEIELTLKVVAGPAGDANGTCVDLRIENKSWFFDILEFKKLITAEPITMPKSTNCTENGIGKILTKFELVEQLERRIAALERMVTVKNHIGK